MTGHGVVSLALYRRPVWYTVRLRQGWDNDLAVWVEDVADDPRSRRAVADAMRRAADMIDESVDADDPR